MERGSKLYKLSKQAHGYVQDEMPLDNKNQRHITCLGYNVKDTYLYALDFNSYELLRISSTGTIFSLGMPDNLDTSFHYFAGGMTADGRRLVVIARNRNSGIDERIYSIRVNDPPGHYAGYFSIVSDVPVTISDIAVDPYVGTTYGFDYHNGQIIETDRTGLTSANHRSLEKVNQGIGALFFDGEGNMFGMGSASQSGGVHNNLYRIDKLDGKIYEETSFESGEDSDGCSCPYTILFEKEFSSEVTTGCNNFTVEYTVTNRAGIGQVGLNLFDVFPTEFKIVEIDMENMFNVEVRSGVNSHFLDIDRWTLLLGENKVKLNVTTGDIDPQDLLSQANLKNNSLALGETIFSDYPETKVVGDPTPLSIVDPLELSLEDNIWTSCSSDTTFLTLPLEGNFSWSTGETTPIISVLNPGLYSVTVENSCLTVVDDITLEENKDPLFVDLGPDLSLLLGDQASLHAHTNVGKIEQLHWETSDDIALTCQMCTEQSIEATNTGWVKVTITDDRGCTATDELNIFVNPIKEIFIPNAFSPNGDGINDFFNVYGTPGKITHFHLFDRWGNLIFSSPARDMKLTDYIWDGKINGSFVDPGIYSWALKIEFPDRAQSKYAGSVMVIR